ncbi:hypothetical protein [Leisingera sp. McT4-56]|uniref:hypothetical protein n=1 Tax=Leisingera sp. McT4-56 TaxID=2881255 RepID=UPI001CF909A1|nr:hypothetical protein [Leisingera sp. McT4-56]MCB4458028.1 hypothetical protein [Leisingera sp. McT4-56]
MTDHDCEALLKRGYISDFGLLLVECDDLMLAKQLDEILEQHACEDTGAEQECVTADTLQEMFSIENGGLVFGLRVLDQDGVPTSSA